MTEFMIEAKLLPESISRLITTEMVKVRESNGEIMLLPVRQAPKCPLRGILSDGRISSYVFMERKKLEKELEDK